MRILVIEDDASVLEYIGRGLRESGFTVDQAADGNTQPNSTSRPTSRLRENPPDHDLRLDPIHPPPVALRSPTP